MINLAGQRFGKLVAERPAHIVLSSGRKMPAWECRCDCGAVARVQGHHLRGGKSRSCGGAGCREFAVSIGVRRHPLYGTWWQMCMRCENPNTAAFPHYGGRGIRVCNRWRHGEGGRHPLLCFADDMGPRPIGMSIDRKDVNGNYEPGNCRWATDRTQRFNTRRSVHVVIGGVRVPLLIYAARLGLSYEEMRKAVRRGLDARSVARRSMKRRAA